MKKNIFAVAITLFGMLSISNVQAQSYRTSLGLNIDLGDGGTYVGPQVKHFFNKNSALDGQLLFGKGISASIGVNYTYNEPIPGARGLAWYVGIGPNISFPKGGGNALFALRPQVGLEFKIPSAPLAMHFDWKPLWNLSQESNFIAGRFSIGFKYAFK